MKCSDHNKVINLDINFNVKRPGEILSSELKYIDIVFSILDVQTTYNTTLIEKEHFMNSKAFDLEERLVSFVGNIILFCKKLPNDFCGSHYANKIIATIIKNKRQSIQ